MSECTSIISEMHNNESTSTTSVALKMKYAVAKSMSKSMATRT